MNKKSLIVNRTWLVIILGALIFVGFAVYFFLDYERLWGWVTSACAAIFLCASMIIPAFFRLDRKGVRIIYLPVGKEIFDWKDVESVKMEYDVTVPYIFDSMYILGERQDAPRFYKEGRITRTRRAERLVEAYFGKPIDGRISDDIKGFAKRRRAKLEMHAHPTAEEAKKLERQSRRILRETLSGFGDGENISVEYYYRTKDGIRQDRPAVGYTYCARLSIRGDAARAKEISLATVKRKGSSFIGSLTPEAIDNLTKLLSSL